MRDASGICKVSTAFECSSPSRPTANATPKILSATLVVTRGAERERRREPVLVCPDQPRQGNRINGVPQLGFGFFGPGFANVVEGLGDHESLHAFPAFSMSAGYFSRTVVGSQRPKMEGSGRATGGILDLRIRVKRPPFAFARRLR
jgi:hypothetical protein